jgi:hypothetical protein
MKTITVELPDDVYKVLQEMSERHDKPLELLALEWVTKHRLKPRRELSQEERREGMEQLLRWAGAGNATDADSNNDRMDADLAKEYGDSHESGH